jgi:Predicted membrane protein
MNWQEILLGDKSFDFLPEIILRTLIMYLLLFTGLRIIGKRAINQLSIFELLMIIALGSAAGDPMIYNDVGILNALVVFIVVFGFYKVILLVITHSEKAEKVLEGKPFTIIRQGKASVESLNFKELAMDELLVMLRNQHVLHLGEVETGVIETNGELSLLFYKKEDVKPGLPVWPDLLKQKIKWAQEEGIYACTFCAHTQQLARGGGGVCGHCLRNDEWVKTKDDYREK